MVNFLSMIFRKQCTKEYTKTELYLRPHKYMKAEKEAVKHSFAVPKKFTYLCDHQLSLSNNRNQ